MSLLKLFSTALCAEFYIFLKKQFTPPPLCAALGGTGGSVNCFLARRAFFLNLFRTGTHNTETVVVVVAVVRVVAVPARHGTDGSIAAPRAATKYAVRTRRRAGVGGAAVYTAVPVVTPFIHVSAHVVYVKRVCILAFYFVGFTATVT